MRARQLLLGPLLAFASTAGAGELDYAQARALAERDEATVPPAQAEHFFTAQGKALAVAVEACLDRDNPPSHVALAVVMEFDAEGRVARTWRADDQRMTVCVEGRLAATGFPPPPRAPFYSFVELDLDVTVE